MHGIRYPPIRLRSGDKSQPRPACGRIGCSSARQGQTGGYDAHRYDFDLSQAPASEKTGTLLAGKRLGGMVNNSTGGHVGIKDYHVNGSAWLAKDDGRMVKFS